MKKLPMLTKSFLGFSLFLVIPFIIVGFIFYYNVIRYSENEISKSSIANLQTVKRLNDQLVDSINKQTIRLSLDVVLQDISDIKQYHSIKSNPDSMVKLMEVTQILSETANINFRMHSIYLYPDHADYVITNRGIIQKNDFTDTGWIAEYEKSKGQIGAFWLNSRLLDNIDKDPYTNKNVITFILPMNTLMINYDGAIVVNIFERELYSYMNEPNGSKDGTIFIINNEGTVVSHEDKNLIRKNIADLPHIQEILNSNETSGFYLGSMDDSNQMLTYYKTEFNNWIYIGALPLDSLLGKTSALLNRIMLVLIALMLTGIIFSYFFSRSMYNPVKKLMQDIQKRKGIDFKGTGNEMAVLSRVFDALAKQEDALSNALEKNRRELQDKYITDLLKGNTSQLTSFDKTSTGISFIYPYYVCAVIAIDRYELFNEKYSPDQQYYMKMMILKACDEITDPSFHVNGVLYEKNKIAVVINSEHYFHNNTDERLNSSLVMLQKEVAKVMNNSITIGVGRYCKDLNLLSTSFNEAQEALANRMVKGSGSIIFYNDSTESESRYFYPYQIETHLLNFLKLGSRQEVYGSIDDLIHMIRNRSGISPDNVIQIFIQLIGNTVKFLVEQNINIGDVFGGDYNVYQKLASKETLDDIKVWLTGFYSGVLQYMADSMESAKSHADKVMDYIHKNYRTNIDTTSIAVGTGLGYSSIGRIVKNKTGKNVLEYINGLRIGEAKRLLRQTNMNIADIAQTVGYNNDQSFSRFFKKFEGVTPGDFRNLQNNQ